MMRALSVLTVLLCAANASAQEIAETAPPIREIVFEGNKITQERVMRREFQLAPGDPADPEAIEQARQAIQNLGLFRSVMARQEIVDGGVRVVFRVREKWYVLPLPRIEANSDGDYGYGGQLKWSNLWGLNHRIDLLVVKRKIAESDRDAQLSYSGSYLWPFIGGSRNNLSLSAGHIEQDSILDDQDNQRFRETFDYGQIIVTRNLGFGPSTQGWTVGGGVSLQSQTTSGEFAPPADGDATSAIVTVNHRDVRFNVYSEVGEAYSARLDSTIDEFASDYDVASYVGNYSRYWYVGERAHQSAHLIAGIGGFHGGPARDRDAFSLGGSSRMRGYDREFIEGDFFYYLSGEFLRPVRWDWLRVLALVEVGSAYPEWDRTGGRKVYVDIGFGARARFTWFVNFELEAGVAYPLIDGGGLRVFAGGA